jgi:hypothetical protein
MALPGAHEPKQAISHSTPTSPPPPTTLSHRNLIPSRLQGLKSCAFHILPTGISVVLLALNFSTVYYENVGTPGQNLRLNALQFVAKLHEVLIAASLSAVAVDYMQYELFHGAGLSIGAFISGLQITSLESLWRAGFWSSATPPGFRTRHLIFAVMVTVLVVLAAAVGPSSAILFIPAIGWWGSGVQIGADLPGFSQVTDARAPGAGLHLYLGGNDSELWPTHVGGRDYMPADCNFTDGLIPSYCPAGGTPSLLEQANFQWSITGWNVSMPAGIFDRTLVGAVGLAVDGSRINTNNYLTQTTTAPMDHMLHSVANGTGTYQKQKNFRFKASLVNGSQTLVPRAYSICTDSTVDALDGSSGNKRWGGKPPPGPYVPNYNFSFPSRDGDAWSVDGRPFLQLWNETNVAAFWIEPPNVGNNTPSIAAIIISASRADKPRAATIEACSLYASWQPAEIYVEPDIDSDIHSSSNENGNERQLQFDVKWANSALPMNSTILPLSIKVVDGTGIGRLGIPLSMLAADAMARFGTDLRTIWALDQSTIDRGGNFSVANSGPDNTIVLNNADVDRNTVTEIRITASQNGYSYSMSGSTRRLAAGILLVHLLIVIVHTVLVAVYSWKRPGMKSIYDALVAAIRSPAGQIEDLSIERTAKLYNQTVKLREVPDSHLEFALHDHKKIGTSTEDNEENTATEQTARTSLIGAHRRGELQKIDATNPERSQTT